LFSWVGLIFVAEALLDEASLQVVLFAFLTEILSVPINILKRRITYLATSRTWVAKLPSDLNSEIMQPWPLVYRRDIILLAARF
jgi:hypothetical protein